MHRATVIVQKQCGSVQSTSMKSLMKARRLGGRTLRPERSSSRRRIRNVESLATEPSGLCLWWWWCRGGGGNVAAVQCRS